MRDATVGYAQPCDTMALWRPASTMDQPTHPPFTLGDWLVDPVLGSITRDDETIRLEPRTMRLLVCLSERAGEVVSADDLLDRVWPNVIVTPDSVYQAVAGLRRLLGDNPKDPRYIVTVPKQGYRMVAAVSAAPSTQSPRDSARTQAQTGPALRATSRRPWNLIAVAAALIVIVGVAAFARYAGDAASRSTPTAATPNPKSVAVLPFLDLTESMGEEVFADGMTEELIDKFALIPGLRVPPPTASFWFKDKQMTVAEIARKLDVAYVLDGSVRKSGAMLRVAARLVRASDGFVVWSETYDRPADDKLMIQDDIAGEVRKALETTIARNTAPADGKSG